MALKIHVVKRKIQAGQHAGEERYYGQVRMKQVVGLEDLSMRVAEDASATAGDVELVVNSLVKMVGFNLRAGKIVDLGDFGRLRLSAGSDGVLGKSLFKGWMMRPPKVVFTPGRLFNNMLDKVKYEWLKEEEIDQREPCPELHS